MNIIPILLNQIIIMVIIAFIGLILTRFGLLDPKANKYFSNLLLYAVAPCIILNAFNRDFDRKEGGVLFAAFVLSLFTHVFFAAIAEVSKKIRLNPGNSTEVETVSIVYSNAGYIGIPLVSACFGNDGVFFLNAYISVFYIFLWTHGVMNMSHCSYKDINIKKLLYNPCLTL